MKQYLDAEVQHVVSRIRPGDMVLELGCGYGRILGALAAHAGGVWGIDTARASLHMGRSLLNNTPECRLVCSDASRIAFADESFDVVVCIQNGISAFHVDRHKLIRESLRITKPGGIALFSSYAARFWPDRLVWFRVQADHGLLGEIDYTKTGNGVIVCKDGFRATTVSPGEFRALAEQLHFEAVIEEVDNSSVFCEFRR